MPEPKWDEIVLKPDEYLVLVSDQYLHPNFDSVPDDLRGRIFYVMGAKAHAVTAEVLETLTEVAEGCNQ